MRTAGELWSAFWKTAGRDGCTLGFPAPRQAAIARRWRTLLTPPHPGPLLDIACGRGAVLAHARAAGWSDLCGIDAAAPDALDGADPAVRGGIDLRALPFDDRSFAVVASQFGLEYGGFEGALAEAARVCSNRMILLLHAAEGVVVAHAREQAAQAGWIDDELDGFGALLHVAAGQAAGRRALAAVLDRVRAAIPRAANHGLLTGFAQGADALARMADPRAAADFRDEWREHAARMREMTAAAPDRAAVERAAARLRADGFAVEISDDGGAEPLIGRWLIAQRRERVE